jgi:SAM-dependent methyltransferase
MKPSMSKRPDPERVRRHFDHAAGGYARRFSRGPLAVLRWSERRQLFALLEPRAGERILDAGCGVGLHAEQLVARGCLLDAVDLSPAMVERARARGIGARVADLHGLDLGRRYDKILCAGPLEFCAEPALVIERLAQHLEPGGCLVILFPTPARGGRLYQYYYRALGVHVHLFEVGEMVALLERTGLAPHGLRRPASFSVAVSALKPR